MRSRRTLSVTLEPKSGSRLTAHSAPTAFGLSEKSTSETRLRALLSACHSAAQEGCIFRGFEATRSDRLAPAYALYTAIEEEPDCARILEKSPELLGDGMRFPSIRKPALLAVFLVCAPQTEADRKKCSDWSCLLFAARKSGIEAADFVTWSKSKPIREAKAECARSRGSQRPSERKVKLVLDKAKFPCLSAVIGDTSSEAAKIKHKLWAVLSELEATLAKEFQQRLEATKLETLDA